ncbi:MAG: bifunctional N-acetylglucosamine-1-phosphate uridyltransferase/glucosamine-1-phosphate acetyltransferase [Trueperaceae bacterium]|nr:bifunctional N-acetylglucosamine-1-phosphate uridyltransferase/glucosamine-1-phosphate acetyltransferase [Trueperaceae bacterium]MCC6310306.1 bifunctional N-acetylglucosamine-1-phosphate uridyltransferase/glucosamine-1-phosphate acetyltransferase [Trueperaceae bacterium]MCO5174147.1 NTP transferase domain-containing protein [Trueperaceae bacterium]MCW5820496.1 bifunctional N-acetylglucosamine-1-phosphate uridyltransferase/glucosamine-1-phosphate acetyltransferase [Trueperaceae bacterium]
MTDGRTSGRPPLAVVVLAAGEGKRMRSKLHKVLHEAAGAPLLRHILDATTPLEPSRTVVVVGFSGEAVRERFEGAGVTFVTQDFSTGYGTGHALRESRKGLEGFSGNVLVLNGDGPLLRSETLAALVALLGGERGMALLTCVTDDPTGLGRIVRGPDGELDAIVEEKDATPEQRAIHEINPGVYLFDDDVFRRAAELRNDNAAGEYYITDLPRGYLADGLRVRTLLADERELLGVNDRRQLAVAERLLRERYVDAWLTAGVTMLDPATTYLDGTVELAADVVLEQGVALRGSTRVGEGARVGAYSVLTDAEVPAGASVPPHTVRTGRDW